MKYSVVISAFNAQDTIGSCLDALVDQELLPNDIIIVDNNSTDKTVQFVQEFKEKNKELLVILAKEEKKCPAAARNKGIELATGDIIVFTDSDCIPRRDWIRNVNSIFIHENPDAVGGIIDVWWNKKIAQRYQAAYWIEESRLLKRTWLTSKERFFSNEFVITSNLDFKRNALIGYRSLFQQARIQIYG